MDTVHRRNVFSGLASSTLVPLLACSLPSWSRTTPNVGKAATGIDVHCHVFNARDIPIVGFVTDIVLEGVPIAPQLLKPLIVLLALAMDLCSWPADKEAHYIASGERADLAIATGTALDNAVQSLSANALNAFQSKNGRYTEFSDLADRYLDEEGRRAAPIPGYDADKELLLFLANRGRAASIQNRAMLANPILANRYAARGITAVSDQVNGTFQLAYLLTRRRLELVERLSNLPASQADVDSIALYCPAMVDY